jgi:hypothetical protein
MRYRRQSTYSKNSVRNLLLRQTKKLSSLKKLPQIMSAMVERTALEFHEYLA